jgi:hypothetical protein
MLSWELEQVEECIRKGENGLALRYLSKFREHLFCMRCKEEIRWQLPEEYKSYFKGFVHKEECERKDWDIGN